MIFVGGFYGDGKLGIAVFDKQPGTKPRFKEGFTLTAPISPHHSAVGRLRELYNKYLPDRVVVAGLVAGLSKKDCDWFEPYYLKGYSDEMLRSYVAGVIGLSCRDDWLGIDIYQAKGALLALAAIDEDNSEED